MSQLHANQRLALYADLTVRGPGSGKPDILAAYLPSRGPDALSTDRYDVIAKVTPDASKEQRMVMLQSLLAERFKLVVHRETKELPIYALVAGKNGPRLRGAGREMEVSLKSAVEALAISQSAPHLNRLLATTLQGFIGDTVADETGLAGLSTSISTLTWTRASRRRPCWFSRLYSAARAQAGCTERSGRSHRYRPH